MKRILTAMAGLSAAAVLLSGCGLFGFGDDQDEGPSLTEQVNQLVTTGGGELMGILVEGSSVQILAKESGDVRTRAAGTVSSQVLSSARDLAAVPKQKLDVAALEAALAKAKERCGTDVTTAWVLGVPGSADTLGWSGCGTDENASEGLLTVGGKPVASPKSWISTEGIDLMWQFAPAITGTAKLRSFKANRTEAEVSVTNPTKGSTCPQLSVRLGIKDGPFVASFGCSVSIGQTPGDASTKVSDYPAAGVIKQVTATAKAQGVALDDIDGLESRYLEADPNFPILQVSAGSKQFLSAQRAADAKRLTDGTGENRKKMQGTWPSTLKGGWSLEKSGRGEKLPGSFYVYTKGSQGVYIIIESSNYDDELAEMTNKVTKGNAVCGLETNTGYKLPQCLVKAYGKSYVKAFRNIHYPATLNDTAEVANAFYAAVK